MTLLEFRPDDVRDYLESLEVFGIRMGLERIRALASALGDPQNAYRVIHVVGTNGKSSVTRFIASILAEHGMTVGAYVSPHLVSLAERQFVNGVCPSERDFFLLLARVKPVADEVNASLPAGDALTQFEVLTAAAFLYFKEQGCEVAVIEAGLGGRCDATSIVSSEVQVLTTIGLEHTDLLGAGLLDILEEKAAVIPLGGKVMAGALEPEVKDRLKAICRQRQAMPCFLDEEISLLTDVRHDSFDVFGVHDFYGNVKLSVLGDYQKTNAALAIGAAELFMGEPLDLAKVKASLMRTEMPGRLEVISEQPLCILDGAHNPSGIAELVRSLDRLIGRRRLIGVVSILKDKEAEEMLRELAPRCDILFVTRNSSRRSYSPEELVELMSLIDDGPEVFADPDSRSALMSAYKLATSNQVVLATGSLYLISDLKRSLGV